jgi:hypothetical protein
VNNSELKNKNLTANNSGLDKNLSTNSAGLRHELLNYLFTGHNAKISKKINKLSYIALK